MVKVETNPIGCMDVFFATDKQANNAKEKLATTWDVSKKWEKHVRVLVHGYDSSEVMKKAEGYVNELTAIDGFLECQLDITNKVIFVKGELA